MNLFDPICSIGHADFNNLIFNEKNTVRYSSKSIESKSLFLFHLKSLENHFRFIRRANEDDVFLVFNNISLFICIFLFKKIKCSFIVHNNYDFGTKSFFHSFIYGIICKKVSLIYLENRLHKKANELFHHKHSYVVKHPIINIQTKRKLIQNKIFVSGRNLDEKDLIKVCRIEKNLSVYCNKKFEGINEANLESGFINDFDKLLNECEKIYIIGNYNSRASGVLYRALSLTNVEIVFSNRVYLNEIIKYVSDFENKPKLSLIKL